MTQRPLPQPPNPDDLRRHPPASAECARMRGLMRDFVDGELSSAVYAAVEQHVHDCRDCGLALARAEHELLQVKRVFSGGERAVLPAGFVGGVLGKLVEAGDVHLEDGSLEDGDGPSSADPKSADPNLAAPALAARLSGGGSEADEVAGVAADERDGLAVLACRFAISTPGILALGMLVLAALVVVQNLRTGGQDMRPERLSRLVITSAVGAQCVFGDSEFQLGSGDGVGDDRLVWVGADGQAMADWHDTSERKQPAATFQLGGNSAVRLFGGEPVLVNGKLQVEARRSFDFAVADGSRLKLDAGDYVLSASSSSGERWDPRHGKPVDLQVRLEVLAGEAFIEREDRKPIFLGAGSTATYTANTISIESRPNAEGSVSRIPGSGGTMPTNTTGPGSFRGSLYERNGHLPGGASVIASYRSNRQSHSHAVTTDASGEFEFATGLPGLPPRCDSPFAVLQVQPPAGRPDLGLLPPDAYRLRLDGAHVAVNGTLVLDASAPFHGVVRLDGLGVRGARLLPIVIDELFGGVLPWANGVVATDDLGRFTVRGLPARMPVHQHLALVVMHPELEATVVPVPARSSPAAALCDGVIAARRLVPVRLHTVPANQDIEIWQDVPGLPAGAAARLFTVKVNAFGSVPSVRVAAGAPLYFRRADATQGGRLRPLELVNEVGQPTYQPANGASVPFHSVFSMSEVFPGSQLAFSNEFRHQHFATTAPTQARRDLYVTEALTGSVVGGAQVFALQPGGPRDRSRARFLGFTSMTGALSYEIQAHDLGIHVVAPGGATQTVDLGALLAAEGWVQIVGAGRVLVGGALRPPSGETPFVSARFERLGVELGLRPVFDRFTGEALSESWVLGELPAGQYRVTIRDQERVITVPPGGLVVLN